MGQRFLVTGGAGYVGSHLVAALVERGDTVVVLDNLRTGHRGAVPPGVKLIVANLADTATVDAVLAEGPWHAVFHFASLSQVGESMRLPLRYLIDNGVNGMRLIEACVQHGISRFVLSSTAALYGTPDVVPIPEDARLNSESPYGDSKWFLERALLWAERVHGLRYASLRYFNAAGADPAGRYGEDHRPETHLVPLVIGAALGWRGQLDVYGDDYETPDGTCLRDYVHVSDLADAHVRTLDYLAAGGASTAFNLGTGAGTSVRAILDAIARVTGAPVPIDVRPASPGDPPSLVANPARARAVLGWTPRHSSVDEIVATAWAWEAARKRRGV